VTQVLLQKGQGALTLKSLDSLNHNFPAMGCLFPGVADNSVKAEVHGIIQGLPVPWPLHDPNACHLSGLTCPLQPGNNYHYTATFSVLKSYPKVSSSLQTEYVFMPHQIVAVV
jgi:hypothetical protein